MSQDGKSTAVALATSSRSKSRPQPRYVSSLCAGALSGLTVDLLFYPIDTLKTRLQSSQGFLQAGGFSGIYRGIGSVAVGSAPGAAVFFVAYEGLKPVLSQFAGSSPSTSQLAAVHMASASIAEVAACLIRVPTEVVKSRQQTSTYGERSSSLAALKAVIQQSGIRRGLYVGFSSTVGREIPFTCIQFPLYEQLKRAFARQSDGALPTWKAGIAGSIAGAIAAGLTTPLDVVKTRIMLHTRQTSKQSPAAATVNTTPGVNTRIIPTLLHIYQTEGLQRLFSGFIPRTMWIGLGGFAFLGTFEAGIKLIEGDRPGNPIL